MLVWWHRMAGANRNENQRYELGDNGPGRRQKPRGHPSNRSRGDWVGLDQKRFFELSDNRLTLSTPPIRLRGVPVTAVLIWERVA